MYGFPKGNLKRKGVMVLENNEFKPVLKMLQHHLETEKVFVKNPERYADVQHATEIAKKLFSTMEITIQDDPLQTGSLTVCIEGFAVIVKGEREIKLFQELVSKADNFEIRPFADETLQFNIMFNRALTKVK